MAHIFVREVIFKSMADAMKGMQVAARVVKFYKEAVGTDIQLQRAISGSPVRLRFVAQLDSLDKWRADSEKVSQDPAFHQLLGEMALLVDGTRTTDELWAS
ncbi:MAG TPA: hypothetical protein VGE20_06585 [Ramlibacter sp.]